MGLVEFARAHKRDDLVELMDMPERSESPLSSETDLTFLAEPLDERPPVESQEELLTLLHKHLETNGEYLRIKILLVKISLLPLDDFLLNLALEKKYPSDIIDLFLKRGAIVTKESVSYALKAQYNIVLIETLISRCEESLTRLQLYQAFLSKYPRGSIFSSLIKGGAFRRVNLSLIPPDLRDFVIGLFLDTEPTITRNFLNQILHISEDLSSSIMHRTLDSVELSYFKLNYAEFIKIASRDDLEPLTYQLLFVHAHGTDYLVRSYFSLEKQRYIKLLQCALENGVELDFAGLARVHFTSPVLDVEVFEILRPSMPFSFYKAQLQVMFECLYHYYLTVQEKPLNGDEKELIETNLARLSTVDISKLSEEQTIETFDDYRKACSTFLEMQNLFLEVVVANPSLDCLKQYIRDYGLGLPIPSIAIVLATNGSFYKTHFLAVNKFFTIEDLFLAVFRKCPDETISLLISNLMEIKSYDVRSRDVVLALRHHLSSTAFIQLLNKIQPSKELISQLLMKEGDDLPQILGSIIPRKGNIKLRKIINLAKQFEVSPYPMQILNSLLES